MALIGRRLLHLSGSGAVGWGRRLSSVARGLADSVRLAFDRSESVLRLRIEPLEGLEPLGAGQWIATDSNPRFLLSHPRGIPAGDFLLSGTLDGPALLPTLHFDFGEGFIAGAPLILPEPRSGRLEVPLHIPRGTTRLRLCPAERSGRLTLRNLTLLKLGRPPDRDAAPGGADRESPGLGYTRWRSLFVELDGAQITWFAANAAQLQRHAPTLLVVDDGSSEHLDRVLACIAGLRFVKPTLCFVGNSRGWPEERVRSAIGTLPLRYSIADAPRGELLVRAAEQAQTPYVLLVGSAELLPHAAAAVAASLSRAPDTELLYWDEELAGEKGPEQPILKPAWSPTLLQGRNYVGDAFVVRRTLVCETSLKQRTVEQSEHGLLLGLSPTGEKCQHLPAVLGLRRRAGAQEHGGPTLPAPAPDRLAISAGRTASTLRLRPLVSIIIPTRDGLALLRTCLASLEKTTYSPFEVLVVDNGSRHPGTLEFLETERAGGRIRVLRDDRPFNFAALNNRAVEECSGALVCLMNDDIEAMEAGWLSELVGLLSEPGVGAVGPMLLYPDGRVQHAGVVTGMHGVAAHLHRGADPDSTEDNERLLHVCEVGALTAACLLIPRDLYRSVGGMNARSLAVAFNDVDLCMKLRLRGRRLLWTPVARLIHHESMTRGADDLPENRPRLATEITYMRRAWGEQLRNDPYFNPNLSLESAQPVRLAPHPRVRFAWPRASGEGAV